MMQTTHLFERALEEGLNPYADHHIVMGGGLDSLRWQRISKALKTQARRSGVVLISTKNRSLSFLKQTTHFEVSGSQRDIACFLSTLSKTLPHCPCRYANRSAAE